MSEFIGDLDGYLAYADANPRPNPHWCPKHWAPCPVEGKNGLIASILVTQAALEEMPSAVREEGAAAMNTWVESREQPTCCRLGDERMAAIWAEADDAASRGRADE